jgi:hypothetical protein
MVEPQNQTATLSPSDQRSAPPMAWRTETTKWGAYLKISYYLNYSDIFCGIIFYVQRHCHRQNTLALDAAWRLLEARRLPLL